MSGYGPVTPDDVDHDEDQPSPHQQLDAQREADQPWQGHRDLCSLQWSDTCDCLD